MLFFCNRSVCFRTTTKHERKNNEKDKDVGLPQRPMHHTDGSRAYTPTSHIHHYGIVYPVAHCQTGTNVQKKGSGDPSPSLILTVMAEKKRKREELEAKREAKKKQDDEDDSCPVPKKPKKLTKADKEAQVEKDSRTVFVGNVPIQACKDSKVEKSLKVCFFTAKLIDKG